MCVVRQCGLLEKFPEEAGAKDPSDRIIPFLPGLYVTYLGSVCMSCLYCVCECVCVLMNAGKKLLGRSQVRSVAEKRKDRLNDYCKVQQIELCSLTHLILEILPQECMVSCVCV